MTDLTSVFDDAHLRNYAKGQIVLYQGERTPNVFQIRSGYVKVYDVNAQGNEKLMLILGPDDIFPLVWAFGRQEALHYFYESFDDVELCAIPKENMVKAINEDHKIAVHLLSYFVDRTQDLMNRIECIDAASAKHKVAQVLSYLANAHGESVKKETYKVKFPVTHQSIADMAGVTRETASLQLKDLESEKIATSEDGYYTVDQNRLNEFLDVS